VVNPTRHYTAGLLRARPEGCVEGQWEASLSVAEMTKFRREVRGAGGNVKVAKNKLVKLALEGTDDLLETIEKVRARANPTLRILGVVITMHDKRTSLARDIRAQIDKVFGSKVFRTVITKSVRLEESPAYKESIFSFAPESSGAAEYYRLCEEVMDRA